MEQMKISTTVMMFGRSCSVHDNPEMNYYPRPTLLLDLTSDGVLFSGGGVLPFPISSSLIFEDHWSTK